MGWSDTTLWLALAGVLVVIELLTGTFFLLVWALGAVAGAAAAWVGGGLAVQLIAAALIGAGGSLLLQRRRTRAGPPVDPAANPDVHLDLGSSVQVNGWGADRRARVLYRGAQWDAALVQGANAGPGPHRIVRIEANCLWLEPSG